MSQQEQEKYQQLRGLIASSLNTNGVVTVKAFYEQQIRRIPILNPELTYNELCLMMQRLFKLSQEDFYLQYRDDEGDWIQLVDDVDVLHAVSISSVISVRIQMTKNPSTKIGLELAPQILPTLSREITEIIARLDSLAQSLGKLEIINGDTRSDSKSKEPPTQTESKAEKKKIKPLTNVDVAELLDERVDSFSETASIASSKQSKAPIEVAAPAPTPPPREQSQPIPPQPNQALYHHQQNVHYPPQPNAGYYGPPPANYPYQQQHLMAHGQPPTIQTTGYPGYPPSPTQNYQPNAPPPSAGYSAPQTQFSSSIQSLPPSLTQNLQMPRK